MCILYTYRMGAKIHTTLIILGLLVLGISLLVSPDTISSYLPNLLGSAQIEYIKETPLHATLTREKKEFMDLPMPEPISESKTIPEHIQPIRKEIVMPEPEAPKEEKKRLPQQTLYAIASERVVNLFCKLDANEVAIATGVIIHADGYILTNAHITGVNTEPCLIRRGSPARNFAIASRVFIPPDFSVEKTTRENLSRDIAIWKITDVLDPEAAATFPSLAIHPTPQITNGSPLSTFSYPAELLGSQTVISALYLSFSETIVSSHDTHFIESAQGLGSQKGSSGGILLDPYTGEFAGLIFAINDDHSESISERTLFSLTPFAIQETVRTVTGKNLETYLAEKP